MKTRLGVALLAAAFLLSTGLPLTAAAGQGGSKANRHRVQSEFQVKTNAQQRWRDGSPSNMGSAATQSGPKAKKGNTYGPGDGTGYDGVGPGDGTGYGAPSQR